MRIGKCGWIMALAVTAGHAKKPTSDADRSTSRPPHLQASDGKTTAKEDWGPIPKIIGGGGALPGEFPWMAALVSRDEPSNIGGFFCGGTLIHPWWVVTAAHCLEGIQPGSMDVVIGATNLATDANVQRLPVAEIIIHPGYNPLNSDGDIALIRLASPATGAPANVLPIIDLTALADPGVTATATGWGDTTNGSGNYPDVLQKVDLPIVSLATANATSTFSGTLSANMLPAGFAGGGKDTCPGDSGGPLIVPSPVAPGFMLAGVTSFGFGCGQPQAYGIYVRVSNYRPWLLGHILPGYADHERQTGALGEFRNAGDGYSNFEEFAFRSRPPVAIHDGDGFRFSFTAPADATEIDYTFQGSPDLLAWAGFSVAENDISREPSTEVADSHIRTFDPPVSSGAKRHFIRAAARKSTALAIGLRPLTVPGGAMGFLTPADPPHPEIPGSHAKNYHFDTLPAGQSLAISLRSSEFDGRMELLDTAGTAITDASSNSALGRTGTDESITLTPAAGETYQLRVSGPAAALGGYRLGAWNPAGQSARPPLGFPQTIHGLLTQSDGADPFHQPGPIYRKDDYRLNTSNVAAGTLLQIKMNSTAVDSYLTLVNAETGGMIMVDDDNGGGLNSLIRFMPIPGQAYFVRATTAVPNTTGAYTLSGAVTSLLGIARVATLDGTLTSSSETDPADGTPKIDYRLTNPIFGSPIRVSLSSNAFDTYLTVLDASDGTIVAANDDIAPGSTNSQLTFIPRAGHHYIIRAGAYFQGSTGSFALTTAPGT